VSKLDDIRHAIRSRGKLLVLLSGGLDSTLLAWLAHDVLGPGAQALTFFSPIIRQEDAVEARLIAELIGIPCDVVSIDELETDPLLSANTPERCYLCRKVRDRSARIWAEEHGFDTIADGLNVSDFSEYRPGMKASREDGIWQPFAQFEVTKEEIREYARQIGLPVWDLSSTACLCSRFPFGLEITRDKLKRVEESETFLKRLGFSVCRVRCFPLETAVVEIDDMEKALECKEVIVPALRDKGFLFVTLDLEGFAVGRQARA